MPPEESLRRKLARVRPPRVQITYDVEMMGGLCKVELPFVVGVLADLAGHPDPDAEPPPDRNGPRHRFVAIDRDNFDQVMSEIRPRLALRVPDALRKDGSRIALELHFRGIEDFEPVNVVRQVEPLRELLESRQRLAEPRIEVEHNDQPDDLLQRIIRDQQPLRRAAPATGRPTDDSPASGASSQPPAEDGDLDPIGLLVEGVINGNIPASDDTGRMIAGLDRLLSDQLNAILHDPEFQKLEASWRGLRYLVAFSETSQALRIRLHSTSKGELLRDMQCTREYDRSNLFRKVYTAEYDAPGGMPYGMLIGDFEFGGDPQDIGLLEWISHIAASAHAPFLAAASPRLFGWESFAELAQPRELAEIFGGPEYDGWNAFRESEDSRYVALCLPHILLRDPYGDAGRLVEEFGFEEDVAGSDLKKFLWGNAAYALGTCITDAFAKYGWCARIRGVEGGGRVEGLPFRGFPTDQGDLALSCSTEIAITDRREFELSHLGFLPLLYIEGINRAAFMDAQSCQKPRIDSTPEANAGAEASAQLNLTLTTSRFAHYLAVIGRDMLGRSMGRGECEERLNGWIRNYVDPNPDAFSEFHERNQKFPLHGAAVEVEDDPRRPGCYRVIARLRTHEMRAVHPGGSIRLVVPLTPGVRKP